MYYKDICDKIDELRKERGLSRREVARQAGINENTFACYFKRKYGNFPEKHIESVARVLGGIPGDAQRCKSARAAECRADAGREQAGTNGG